MVLPPTEVPQTGRCPEKLLSSPSTCNRVQVMPPKELQPHHRRQRAGSWTAGHLVGICKEVLQELSAPQLPKAEWGTSFPKGCVAFSDPTFYLPDSWEGARKSREDHDPHVGMFATSRNCQLYSVHARLGDHAQGHSTGQPHPG